MATTKSTSKDTNKGKTSGKPEEKKQTPSASRAVAKREDKSGEVAHYDYGDDVGAGFENTTREDFATPFVKILEALSPEIESIDGAKPGYVFNTSTGAMRSGDEGILFIPVHPDHCFVEWKPDRGGFVARHEIGSQVVIDAKRSSDFGSFKTPDGNDLVDTFYLFGLIVDPDDPEIFEQAVIGFTSTRIKKYRNLMTKARSIQVRNRDGRPVPAPLYAHVYHLTTVEETNKKGQRYHNWSVSFNGASAEEARLDPSSSLYQAARGFRDLALAGSARVDYEKTDQPSGSGGEDPPF